MKDCAKYAVVVLVLSVLAGTFLSFGKLFTQRDLMPPERVGNAPNGVSPLSRSISADTFPTSSNAGTSEQTRASVKVTRTNPGFLSPSAPTVNFERDPILWTPGFVRSTSRFLSAAHPAASVDDIVRAYVSANNRAFCLEPSDLAPPNAYICRDVVTAHNGMRSRTYQQTLHGMDIHGATFAVNLTRDGRIVNVSSRALHTPSLRERNGERKLSAAEAVAAAAMEMGTTLSSPPQVLSEVGAINEKQVLGGSPELKEPVPARLVYYPLDATFVVQAWEVVLTVRDNPETHRIVVDNQTGERLFFQSLTWTAESANYRIFTNDSPTPMSPGFSYVGGGQPSEASRDLVAVTALDTNASPNGWIPVGQNETLGNNVDAYADRDDNNSPDGLRPHGAPYRTFDFPLNLSIDPTNSLSAAIVQAFYAGNVFHDKLYSLGFDEAAGNFQQDNFGRGGIGYDSVKVEVQDGALLSDGSHVNNANFTTLNDGYSGRLQVYIWRRYGVGRDGAFDMEVMFHELAHGVSCRLIGDGYGLSGVQPRALGEGWSDFLALSLLSEQTDDVNGCYAFGGYVAARYLDSNNYYYGVRRFPYSTNMNKAPQTLADIDPTQMAFDPAIPMNPYASGAADESHRAGEVWGLALWECRANLLERYGWSGNEKMQQLVVDAMKLTPITPTFIQARDAILQADLVNNVGLNLLTLWRGFAKRGLGYSATVPAASTTVGIRESFDLPVATTAIATEGPGSDSDGYVEPGEDAVLDIVVRALDLDLTGMSATMSALSEDIVMSQASSSFPDVVSGGATTSAVPFRFSVAPQFPGFTDANFVLTFHTSRGDFDQELSVRIGNPNDYPPEISGVTVFDVGESNATIRWATGLPSDSQVEYGTTADYQWSTDIDVSLTTNHVVTLSGLQRRTFYHFRVKSRGANDLLGVSDDAAFSTRSRIYVSAGSTNPIESGTVETPFKSIPTAVAAAMAGDELFVAAGVYTSTSAEAVLELTNATRNIKVYGGYNADFSLRNSRLWSTVFDGQHCRRGVRLNNGATLEMDGLKIVNGDHQWGGGVSVRSSSLKARDCLISGNVASPPNDAGGGLYATLGAQVVLEGCSIVSNVASYGGGLFVVASGTRVELIRCTISSNMAVFCGGGTDVETGGEVSLMGCMIENNISGSQGGGVSVLPYCQANLVHCTISQNVVTGAVQQVWEGGGGLLVAGSLSTSVANINNCVIYGNVSKNGADLHCATLSEVHCNHSDIGDIYGTMTTSAGRINADPLFFDPESGDFHLRTNSPCIDTGVLLDESGADMDGESRPFGALPDMGADEYVDFDADNLPDYWERAYFGAVTNGNGASDTDSDGLSDSLEYVNRTSPTNVDTDCDNMRDDWEVLYGFDPRKHDALSDRDGDGVRNVDEYRAGTNPTNRDSFLRVCSVALSNDCAIVTWKTVFQKSYWVQRCNELGIVGWTNVTSSAQIELDESGEGTETLVDSNAPSGNPAFYRVRVE